MPTPEQLGPPPLPPPSGKAVVSITEMSRLCGLSRARFYQLLSDGFFPAPKRNAEAKRPFYDAEGQAACLTVKASNCGINGRPVLFYTRRTETRDRTPRTARWNVPSRRGGKGATPIEPRVQSLLDGLRQLGLEGFDASAAMAARSSCFPDGIAGLDDATILTAVFRHLNRQNSGRNVGR